MVRMLTETPGRGVLLATAACTVLSGCYLMQAAVGQYRVLHARAPIDALIADPATDPKLRARLSEVHAAREFASRELALPDNASYRSYADIGREFVVWNVVAAPEFSVEPKHWCFPVAGCVSYRGYFHERRAREFAASLAAGGFDTAVEGVPAFSTLGRFADPVLSSMLRYDDDDLAATIFHELAHQLLYVRDDSEFNEAFATTVEDVGLDRWLAHQGQSSRMQTFRAEQALDEKFVGVLGAARGRLVKLYASGVPRDEMRDAKAAIFNSLTEDIRALENSAGLGPLYDQWIASGLNNARLAAIATYYDCVPGFMRLLKEQDGHLPRFYAAARELASQTREGRHARLCGQANTSAQ